MPTAKSPPNMRAFWRVTFLFVTLLSLPLSAFAISEAGYLKKVLAQDKLLEESQIGLDIKQIELNASRDNYANWKANLYFELGYSYRDLDRDNGTTSDYDNQTRSYPAQIGLAIEKRFLSHPGSLRLGINRSKDRRVVDRTDVPTLARKKAGDSDKYFSYHTQEYATRHFIQFNYPLLKRDSNASSLKTHHRDIIDLKRQQLSFYETKEDFLNERLDDYLSWVLYHRQIEINREFLHNLQQLQPEDESAITLLISTVFQVEKYNSDSTIQLQAIKEKLSVLLNDRTILTETPDYDWQKRATLIDGDLQDYLRTHNRELQRITLNIELNQIEIANYQNQNLPELDIILRAEQDSNQGNTRTSDINDDRTNHIATLEFSYPLSGNISNRASLEKSLLGVRRLELSYQERLQDSLADIQLLNTLLTLDEERLLGTLNATAQTVQIERKNYSLGKTTFRDLLQAYLDERIAKLDYLDTIIDYQKNSIEYDNLLDRIIKPAISQ